MIDQIIHKYDFDSNKIAVKDICSAAAIYGKDGHCWAYSSGFPELKAYDFVVEGMTEAENVKVYVNELEVACKAADGERKPAGEAGVRIGGKKFMFVAYDEVTKTTQCSSMTGGCAMANLKSGVVVAMWGKN